MIIRKDLFANCENSEFRCISCNNAKGWYEIGWHFDSENKKMIYCSDYDDETSTCNCENKNLKLFKKFYVGAINVKNKMFYYLPLNKSTFYKYLETLLENYDDVLGLGKKTNFIFHKEINKIVNMPIPSLKQTKKKDLKISKEQLKKIKKDAINLSKYFAMKHTDKSMKRFPVIKENEMIFFK
jgi:hypothetical protein